MIKTKTKINSIKLTEMPSKELLEEFLNGLISKVTVIFNIETGKFEKSK